MEEQLDALIQEYEELRTELREDHPKVQYVVAEFRRALKIYEIAQTATQTQAT